MPHRIAFGSCSHPSLPQPLWKIIKSRRPAAFVWGGDAIYADKYAGLNWTAVGFHRINDDQTQNYSTSSSWRLTFPPPSIHTDATPEMLSDWYEKQWGVEDYRSFVEGWYDDEHHINNTSQSYDNIIIKPLLFGTVDDHDYGQNNGDYTYQYKKDSNIEFVNFLYSGVANDHHQNDICTQDVHSSDNAFEESTSQQQESNKSYDRHKDNDPMYQRALKGRGVYGVQLFDFSKTKNDHTSNYKNNNNNILWGNGYWVPEIVAQIDPDVITSNVSSSETPSYSTTHSVAIFALDVRTNKTPWPKGKQIHTDNTIQDRNSSSFIPILDFLGEEQWLWFKQALNNSHATVNIIVSGLQVHPERFPNDGNVVEEWSKFPEARQLLYDTILNSGVKSPMIVSGDVHMAQFMRKDCVKASGMIQSSRSSRPNPQVRPLVEITTSGMTHSWGTSFSSQPKHHRLPLKPYSYFVSRVFMTICHLICPWHDILIQSTEEESIRGKTGLQYYLGLNFAEFEFDFSEDKGKGGGTVTTRIFGKEEDAVPKLEMSWTFDELSGNTRMKENNEQYLQDYSSMNIENLDDGWLCIPHRGITSIFQEYVANTIMFISFCILFFFPHAIMLYLLRKMWLSCWKRV